MAHMNQTVSRNRQTKKIDKITIILLVAFIVMAIITAVAMFNLAKNMISSWTMTNIEGIPVSPNAGSEGNVTGGGEEVNMPSGPLQPAGGPTPEPWDGKSRVTILLMGLDYRDWEAGNVPRTDTMMLLTMDPINHTAAMMSIPRDMWVLVPGFDYNKINTAYYYGELYNLPGGGPALAVETVEQFLGVPINYYAQVDFAAFVRFIDEIDGVKITPSEDIDIDPIGRDADEHLKGGETVTLNGELALAYARARYTNGGDFDRAQRQQEVIMAVRDRILEFSMLPKLITKAPKLYQEIASSVRTNLGLEQVIRLAQFAINIDRSKIESYVIDASCVQFGTSPDGLDILIPIPDKIRLLRDEAFTSGSAVAPVAVVSETAAEPDPYGLVKDENARISVQNGSWYSGLAGSTANYLQGLGFNVVEEANAEATNITTIYVYNGKPYTIQAIFDIFENAGLNEPRIYNRTDLTGQLDLSIVLGSDWANYVQNNPLPEN